MKETADSVIEPALKQRNECYQRWLATGRIKDRTKFAKARASARRTVREAKMPGLEPKQKKLNVIGSGHASALVICSDVKED